MSESTNNTEVIEPTTNAETDTLSDPAFLESIRERVSAEYPVEATTEEEVEVEASPEEVEEESTPTNEESNGRAFAILRKKEKQLAKKEQEVQQKLNQINQFEQSVNTIRKDPLAFIEQFMTRDEFHQFLLTGSMEEEPTPEYRIKKLEQTLEQKEQLELERQQQIIIAQQQQALSNIQMQINQELAKGEYPLIQAKGYGDIVLEHLLNTYQSTGVALEISDVCSALEKEIRNVTSVPGTTSDKASNNRKTAPSPKRSLDNSLHSKTTTKKSKEPQTDEDYRNNALSMLKNLNW